MASNVVFLPSNNESRLWDRLRRFLDAASTVRVASAFLGSGQELVEWLDGSPSRRLEVIVRLEFPTHPDSVNLLRQHPKVTIRASLPEKYFHEKLILAEERDGSILGAYVGSANWTQGGLKRNQEAGVWVTQAEVLKEIRDHFKASLNAASSITDEMVVDLRRAFQWQRAHQHKPEKDLGTLISSWRELKDSVGEYILKQNGVSEDCFYEETGDFSTKARNQSAQTFSSIPSRFTPGLGMIITYIARRKDGRPDRLIYGRGRVAGIDRNLWRLPSSWLRDLSRLRGVPQDELAYLKRWQQIVWMNPADHIAYPATECEFLWLSAFMEPSFQKGYRWMTRDTWIACNKAIDRHIMKYGTHPLDLDGIWWNRAVGLDDPRDPLFLTKARIERLNQGGTEAPVENANDAT